MISASREAKRDPRRCARSTVDCRLLPGQHPDGVEPMIRAVLGGDGEYELEFARGAGRDALAAATRRCGTRSSRSSPSSEPGRARGADLLLAGFTDSHWLREAFGTVAYGFFPARAMPPELAARRSIHSADERVPVADLELGVDLAAPRRAGARAVDRSSSESRRRARAGARGRRVLRPRRRRRPRVTSATAAPTRSGGPACPRRPSRARCPRSRARSSPPRARGAPSRRVTRSASGGAAGARTEYAAAIEAVRAAIARRRRLPGEPRPAPLAPSSPAIRRARRRARAAAAARAASRSRATAGRSSRRRRSCCSRAAARVVRTAPIKGTRPSRRADRVGEGRGRARDDRRPRAQRPRRASASRRACAGRSCSPSASSPASRTSSRRSRAGCAPEVTLTELLDARSPGRLGHGLRRRSRRST